jgi:hypothetical protein
MSMGQPSAWFKVKPGAAVGNPPQNKLVILDLGELEADFRSHGFGALQRFRK